MPTPPAGHPQTFSAWSVKNMSVASVYWPKSVASVTSACTLVVTMRRSTRERLIADALDASEEEQQASDWLRQKALKRITVHTEASSLRAWSKRSLMTA